jgi:hypothetical protein
MKNKIIAITGFLISSLVVYNLASAQQHEKILSESKVPSYTLPDPLVLSNGASVKDPETWQSLRRPEILRLFEEHVYGKVPSAAVKTKFKRTGRWKDALNGKATMKEVTATFSSTRGSQQMRMLIFIPNNRSGSVPAFVGYNFYGNQTIHPDPRISIDDHWVRNNNDFGMENNRPTEKSRGVRVNRWPVETIIDRGYALIAIYYGDIDPDFDDGFQNGIQSLFYKDGQDKPADDEWGSIGAWAWGLSRAMDYFEKDPGIDEKKVAVIGHSRLGKTSLWAGARDERFALVISNDSGCGGAALSRRRFGETVEMVNRNFPHWFCDNFNQYNNNEDALPVDQHMLISLMAPRPVYVASAEEDLHADPHGEFLAARHASPVYQLLGTEGLPADKMPEVNQPVAGTIGYHIRSGKHDITDYDWGQYLNFADRYLR